MAVFTHQARRSDALSLMGYVAGAFVLVKRPLQALRSIEGSVVLKPCEKRPFLGAFLDGMAVTDVALIVEMAQAFAVVPASTAVY